MRAILAVLAAVPALAAGPKVDYRDPPREYVTARLATRDVLVESELHEKDPALEKAALARLKANLDLVMSKLPPEAAAGLADIPFYLMYGTRSAGGGKSNGARYFRQGAPDRDPTLDDRWRDCVVVWSAKNYLQQNEVWAAKLLAHELAHARHLRRYPEKQPDILAAYNHAMAAGLYQNVEHGKDRARRKAYATKNQLEYFAELSAMYFVGGNYEPLDREGLRRYDPQGYAMVEKIWGISE